MKVSSLYIHVPFCLKKCDYCDFVSFPVGDCAEMVREYPALIKEELRLRDADLSNLNTVYFGGGTPSLLSVEAVADILSVIPAAAEITLEANPGAVTLEKLQGFRAAGVNRLSLGVQSFDDGLLAAMGRKHNAREAKEAVSMAREAGFDNVGIDLIYGLPDQTMEQWEDSLRQALALDTEHISLYCLTVSDECPWGQQGVEPLDDDLAADMAELAVRMIKEAGYHHYEIANFARPGRESRHNTAYWLRENYLGLGVAAASCDRNHRWNNPASLEEYRASVWNGKPMFCEEEVLEIESVLAEAMFLGLRMLDGIDRRRFEAQYGTDPVKYFKNEIKKLIRNGLMEVTDERMRLSEKGFLLGDVVFREFV